MVKSVNVENLGLITVDYNAMSGKITATLDNKPLIKMDKKTFVLQGTGENGSNEYLSISGTLASGLKFNVRGEYYQITSPMSWYSYILIAIPLIMALVIGNIPELVDEGFYFVGGAIGGAIGGIFSGLSAVGNAFFKKWYIKVLFSLLCIALTFLICWGIGNAIVSAMM